MITRTDLGTRKTVITLNTIKIVTQNLSKWKRSLDCLTIYVRIVIVSRLSFCPARREIKFNVLELAMSLEADRFRKAKTLSILHDHKSSPKQTQRNFFNEDAHAERGIMKLLLISDWYFRFFFLFGLRDCFNGFVRCRFADILDKYFTELLQLIYHSLDYSHFTFESFLFYFRWNFLKIHEHRPNCCLQCKANAVKLSFLSISVAEKVVKVNWPSCWHRGDVVEVDLITFLKSHSYQSTRHNLIDCKFI